MMRIQGLILISIIYTALISVACVMPAYRWVTVPVGLIVTAVLAYKDRLNHREKIEVIHKRLSNLRSEGLIIEERIKEVDSDVFYRMILTLLTDLERSLFKLVEKNIQLLSIKEIGRSIINSIDESKLIDSVFEYLVHGVGYREVAFILLRKNKQCFQSMVCVENTNRLVRRVINLEYDDLGGAVFNSLVSGKAFLIKDASMHPIFESIGDEMFPGSTMSSYICVPMMKTSERNRCCLEDKCCLDTADDESSDPSGKQFMSHPECLSCPENPVLGAIIVTDGFRATPLTNIDQVTVETVGSLVASNIENWLLYQELRHEEVFRENVLEGVQHGLFVCDMEGSITLANRSALELCGRDENSIIGENIDSMISRGSGDDDSSFVFDILQKDSPALFYEACIKRPDGDYIPIRTYVSRLMGEDGEVQGVITTFMDLTYIRRMEEQIKHLDKLAMLGRFTSAIAHEIRNPLTGIAAGIQYMERKGGLSDEQKENITFILHEVERLDRIITDLFKVAKPRDLLYQNADIKGLVERSYKSVSEIFFSKEIELRRELDNDLEKIEVDPDQLTQVLINLLKNAAEAAPEKGIVIVRTRSHEGYIPGMIIDKENPLICFDVIDDGPGIDERDIENIFEPFYSKKVGGTGLGLFISHSIIQHHQGRLSVVSKPGKGTTFTICLPGTRPVKGGKVETGNTSGR
jgi:PAS domain S-box-containing protein